MFSRAAAGRQAQRALRLSRQQQSRGLAEPASGSFQYQTGEAQGVKLASREIPGPVAHLALVSTAGTRFEPLPGLSEALKLYAFKNTARRSTLRIQRESELLGSALQSYHSRESLVVGAKFFQDDLPYFVELLAEVAGMTDYKPHVVHEEIYPLMDMSHKKYLKDTQEMAINSAHGVAFHRGLGVPLYPASNLPWKKYVDANNMEEFAGAAYAKPNIALVANGVKHDDLNKWVKDMFGDVPSQSSYQLKPEQTKYYGGEERIAHGSGNSMVIALSGSSSPTGPFYKPEIAVLAALLGGQSSIKWSPGFSLLSNATKDTPSLFVDTRSVIYSDAGLLTITLSGSANDIRSSAPKVVEVLKKVSQGIDKEAFAKAKALAKFSELEYGQETQAAMELTGAGLVHGGKAYQIDEVAKSVDGVTAEKVQQAAKEALEQKASVSAVGDLTILPFAEELGLKV